MSSMTSGGRDSSEGDANFKLQPWAVTQEDILKLLRTPANLDHDLTLQHTPQKIQSLHAGDSMLSLVHFRSTSGDVFTGAAKNRQLYIWTLNSTNKAYQDLDPHQKIRAVGEITTMVFLPKQRTYVGYCKDKTLRVFMDPVTGCEDIAYLTINHAINCLVYNKDTNEIIAGGKGFVESYGVTGTEFKTKLQKAKVIRASLMKTDEVRELKLDTRNKQIMVLTDKGINVVNYSKGTHTHILVNRHSGSLTCCCIYHDGEFLVTGSTEGDLKIWNSVVYTQVHEFPGHIERVTAICCLPKDPILFSSSTDGTVYVWRMDTFQKFMKLQIDESVLSLRLLQDGTLVAQTAMDIHTYSLKQFYSKFATCNADVASLKRLRALGHQPNKVLVSTEDGRIQLLNPATGNQVSAMLPLPKPQVLTEFAYNGRDSKLYTILKGGDVLILNTAKNPFAPVELLSPPDPEFKVVCLAIMNVNVGAGSANGTTEDTIIFMGTSGGMICVLESQCVLMETPIAAHKGALVCLDSSCDVDPVKSKLKKTSRYLVSAGMDNLVKLWGMEFEPDQGGWILRLVLIQNIDCMGSPSHVAMFENIICVAFGEYGLVKMFRLAGLKSSDHKSELQGLYVLLTHFSQFDHSDTVVALDMCPMVNLFVTCGLDGYVKIWDTNNQLVKEMDFGQPVFSVCFASNRGDLLIGFQNRVLLVPITKFMPQHNLEQMSNMMFADEVKESQIEINAKRKKSWFDPKAIPKYSTDLVTRMTQKVKLKANLSDEDADLLTLERMRSDLSLDSGLGTASVVSESRRPSLTRENTSLSLNDALLRESSSTSLDDGSGPPASAGRKDSKTGRSAKRKGRSASKKRQLDLGDKDLRKISIGETLEEEEEDEGAPTSKELRLARQDSLLYFRKPSVWNHGKDLTPSLLRDLEDTTKKTRYAELMLPEYLRSSTDEVIPITPEPKRGPEYTEEQLRSLTPWERFLLTKKPIIAPDGYIPNSVVRRQIGFVKAESPTPIWQLKPVPDADPRHMPKGWKPKKETSGFSFDGNNSADEEVDLNNIMSMKRQSTLQNVKIQQSIKEASLFIGTAMCLLPDGTEPEGIPNFTWRTDKDEVADLTPLARPRSEDLTPMKESTVVTPMPVKHTPDDKTPVSKAETPVKTQSKPLRKVDIDIGSGLGLDMAGSRGPARGIGKMPESLTMEKAKSFRFSQNASKTPMEAPKEESERGTEENSNPSPIPSEISATTTSSKKTEVKKKTKAEAKKAEKAEARINKTRANRKPIQAPPSIKLTKEEELSLLQRIVKEEWFPPGVPPILELVNDELTKLLDTTETKVFTAVCDYLVQIFKELTLAPKFLNRAGDKLSKQLSSPSAITRKKAVWTLKQLGISAKKDVVSTLLPNLLDAREEVREEMINNLSEMLGGGEKSQAGLTNLMSSLGISNRPLNTKEEQQAAIKAISEKLKAEAEKVRSGSAEGVQKRMEMWVSSLNLPQDNMTLLRSGGSNSRPLDSNLGSRGISGFESETSFDRQSTKSDMRGSKQRSRGKKRGKGGRRKSRQKSSTERGDDNMSMDMSVQTEPQSDAESEAMPPRRGRWRRGGMSEFRQGEEDDEYDDYETEEDERKDMYTQKDEVASLKEEGGLPSRGDSGLFTVIDYDFTPNMFRSETGGSEWSDDVPPLVQTTPGRPKGASVHKFYERREHVSTVVNQDPSRATGGTTFPTMPRIEEPYTRPVDPTDRLEPLEGDSDLHSESNYTDISKSKDSKTHDGVSVVDSGIGKDLMSEVSSHVYGGSDSLFDQGRPRLSPIKSHSNLNKAEKSKEPEWKDFFESSKVQEKRKAADFVRKDMPEDQQVRIPMLPPIMYVDPEQPTLPGEAGLRLLHSVRLADREKTSDTVGRVVEALPGRLTITTHDEKAGDTNYGLLQMHWTTQVPVSLPASLHTERSIYRQGTDLNRGDIQTHRSEPPTETQALPRLPRGETNLHKSVPRMATVREKTLPALTTRERSDFQWSKPMAPAPKRQSLMDAGAQISETHCQQYKWATKNMHHYISSTKNLHLPKMDSRANTFLASSLNEDVLSIIKNSSIALMPSMSLERILKNINISPSS